MNKAIMQACWDKAKKMLGDGFSTEYTIAVLYASFGGALGINYVAGVVDKLTVPKTNP